MRKRRRSFREDQVSRERRRVDVLSNDANASLDLISMSLFLHITHIHYSQRPARSTEASAGVGKYENETRPKDNNIKRYAVAAAGM
jgi:hypothetical protein